MVALDQVKSLKVQELKEELKELGLDTKGVKADLVKRLEEALSGATATVPQQPSAVAEPVAHGQSSKAEVANGRTPIEFKAANSTAPANIAPKPEVQTNEAAATQPAPAEGGGEVDRRKMRAERFGVELSQKDKLEARAARFGSNKAGASGSKPGLSKPTEAEKTADMDKRKERAKRFNLPLPQTTAEEAEKKKARIDRFGAATASSGPSANSDLQKKLAERAERFALGGKAAQQAAPALEPKPAAELSQAEAKRQARMIRFAAK